MLTTPTDVLSQKRQIWNERLSKYYKGPTEGKRKTDLLLLYEGGEVRDIVVDRKKSVGCLPLRYNGDPDAFWNSKLESNWKLKER